MSAKKKYECQAFIEDVYSISIVVEADNEDEALDRARDEAESLAQDERRSLDMMNFQESRVQDEILVEEKDMSEYDKNEPTELLNDWGDLGRIAHKVLRPWEGTWGEVHAILGAHREVLRSKNLECEEDDWLEAARLYPDGVCDTVPGGCSYSMHNVVRWYLVAKREDNR